MLSSINQYPLKTGLITPLLEVLQLLHKDLFLKEIIHLIQLESQM
jgi:hypothetical protein